MNISMKKVIIIIIVLCLLIICFIPFSFYDKDGQRQYCRYRLGVYEAFWDETDLYDPHSSDYIFFFNIKLNNKIGGPLEYFGLKEIENDTIKNNNTTSK